MKFISLFFGLSVDASPEQSVRIHINQLIPYCSGGRYISACNHLNRLSSTERHRLLVLLTCVCVCVCVCVCMCVCAFYWPFLSVLHVVPKTRLYLLITGRCVNPSRCAVVSLKPGHMDWVREILISC